MKSIYYIFLYLSIVLLLACKRHDNFIIETDIEKITLNASKNGLTIAENGKLGILIHDSIRKNTIGKTIPKVMISNSLHHNINLLDELSQVNTDFILISSDIYCGFGLDCILNVFPKSFQKYKSTHKDIPVFCLITSSESDSSDSLRFNETIEELRPLYHSIYIIDEKEAKKLNLFASPTRLYVTKHMVVKSIEFGISLTGGLYDEIVKNTK